MLGQLATSCKKRPSTLAQMLLNYCLENQEIVEKFQEQYNVNPDYRIVGFKLNHHGFFEYRIGPNEEIRPSMIKYLDGAILTPIEVPLLSR